MLEFIFGLFFAFLAVALVAIHRVYGSTSLKELKRRSRHGDELATLLYRPASYGLSNSVFLIGLALLAGYIALALLNAALGSWLTGLLVIVLVLAGTVFVQSNGGMNRVSVWFAKRVSPGIGWLLERLHPVFNLSARIVRRMLPVRVHTGVYKKEDLVQLLETQKSQPYNRIDVGEIDLLVHALEFGDKSVGQTLVPKRIVKTVSAQDTIAPVLLGELHASGHSRFPVYEGKKDNIVGILYLRDIVDTKKSGNVRTFMRTPVRYVHEEATLYDALRVFLKTKQHLFVVVNSFEEYVGIITIEDVLEQVIGTQIVDEFDQHDDLRAVAAKSAQKEHKEHLEAEAGATPEDTEVVE
ncbi:CBS domain-containing protein [Candidatus Saccharibacteria bacterium]|nr:CBS domain-containing protein [Candidatus Saccharibacteria bacterium]